jgi:3-deoxy-manno-octulosonate cytidylyltransferase (CMP-KDO synthetase)
MKIVGIVPARFGSTRLPGKPLARVGSKTMLELVIEQCKSAELLSEVIVATDDTRIMDEAMRLGVNAVMTDATLPSGTDRCAQAIQRLGIVADAVVNIQGDEPFIEPTVINSICKLMYEPEIDIATLARPINEIVEIEDTNKVRVVLDTQDNALYFSRATIPYYRDVAKENINTNDYLIHIGIYAYTLPTLGKLIHLPMGRLEKAEKLEQLRWLEYGMKIRVGIVHSKSFGIDTPGDLERAQGYKT